MSKSKHTPQSKPPKVGPVIRPPVAGLSPFAGLPVVSNGGPRGAEVPILDPKTGNGFSQAALNEIERGAVRRFAESLGETNPIYFDENAARAAGFRDIVAPLLFPLALRSARTLTQVASPNRTVLLSEEQVEQFEPLCAGDQVAVSSRVIETSSRPGNAGPIEFIQLEDEGRNLEGKLLFRVRRSLIVRAGREQPAAAPASVVSGV
jgi:acyl dehydratase